MISLQGNPLRRRAAAVPRSRNGTRHAALVDFDTSARIVRFICTRFFVSPKDLESDTHGPKCELARKLTAWLVHRHTAYGLGNIGALLHRSARSIQEMLDSLEADAQASCCAGCELVALDCAFRAFATHETAAANADDKPF
jgi:hypothetical protein